MGRKIKRSIPFGCYVIDGKVATEIPGKFKACPIRVTWSNGLYNEEENGLTVSSSENMESVCAQILRGEETDWALKEVCVRPDSVFLEFVHPTINPDLDGSEWIHVFTGKGVRLGFAVGQEGDSIVGDITIDCIEAEGTAWSYPEFASKKPRKTTFYFPRIITYLGDGHSRVKYALAFDKEVGYDQYYYTETAELD